MIFPVNDNVSVFVMCKVGAITSEINKTYKLTGTLIGKWSIENAIECLTKKTL